MNEVAVVGEFEIQEVVVDGDAGCQVPEFMVDRVAKLSRKGLEVRSHCHDGMEDCLDESI